VIKVEEELELSMSVTRNMEQIVRDDIARAIEEHAEEITSSNADYIFNYTRDRHQTTWVLQCCTVCR